MGYFCYILSPRAGIDRAVIILREVKTTVRITIFFKFFGTNAYMFPHLTVLSILTVFQILDYNITVKYNKNTTEDCCSTEEQFPI
jgi:lauroyl/myristoyl acyltransferase